MSSSTLAILNLQFCAVLFLICLIPYFFDDLYSFAFYGTISFIRKWYLIISAIINSFFVALKVKLVGICPESLLLVTSLILNKFVKPFCNFFGFTYTILQSYISPFVRPVNAIRSRVVLLFRRSVTKLFNYVCALGFNLLCNVWSRSVCLFRRSVTKLFNALYTLGSNLLRKGYDWLKELLEKLYKKFFG